MYTEVCRGMQLPDNEGELSCRSGTWSEKVVSISGQVVLHYCVDLGGGRRREGGKREGGGGGEREGRGREEEVERGRKKGGKRKGGKRREGGGGREEKMEEGGGKEWEVGRQEGERKEGENVSVGTTKHQQRVLLFCVGGDCTQAIA